MLDAEPKFSARPGDSHVAAVPGADFGHDRAIFLHRNRRPGCFAAPDAERLTRAEYEVAVRSLFPSSAGRR